MEYFACDWLINAAVYANTRDGEDRLACCCSSNFTNAAPFVSVEGDADKSARSFLSLREHIIRQLNSPSGEKTPCHGCASLKKAEWGGGKKIRKLIYNGQGLCNFNCFYCGNSARNNKGYGCKNEKDLFCEILESLSKMFVFSDDFYINLANGEITILPDRERILAAVERYFVCYYTNAFIYDNAISRHLERKKGVLFVSLDAGCAKTFAAVKGAGEKSFRIVADNIKRYSEANARIWLKYIILPGVNDNAEDVDGFIEMARFVNAEQVRISRDLNDGKNDLDARAEKALLRLISQAKRYEFKIVVAREYFSAGQNALIEGALANG